MAGRHCFLPVRHQPGLSEHRQVLRTAGRLTGSVPASLPTGSGPARRRSKNLETSITRSDEFVPGKAVHYRMSPDNVRFLTALRPSVCALANNHVLDLGRRFSVRRA
jgi:poly-gamma-glutamate capsule biosynthesis protein CapA/YwtB (metallophosphatase superfamily)